MPLYECPKCGRIVEMPAGSYYCKVCDTPMREVTATFYGGQARIEKYLEDILKELKEIKSYLARAELARRYPIA